MPVPLHWQVSAVFKVSPGTRARADCQSRSRWPQEGGMKRAGEQARKGQRRGKTHSKTEQRSLASAEDLRARAPACAQARIMSTLVLPPAGVLQCSACTCNRLGGRAGWSSLNVQVCPGTCPDCAASSCATSCLRAHLPSHLTFFNSNGAVIFNLEV